MFRILYQILFRLEDDEPTAACTVTLDSGSSEPSEPSFGRQAQSMHVRTSESEAVPVHICSSDSTHVHSSQTTTTHTPECSSTSDITSQSQQYVPNQVRLAANNKL